MGNYACVLTCVLQSRRSGMMRERGPNRKFVSAPLILLRIRSSDEPSLDSQARFSQKAA
jgi:hypothetical protein